MVANVTQVDAIFSAAIEIVSAEERAQYVAQACGDDAELLQRVESLLASHSEAGSFLESPPATVQWLKQEILEEGPSTVIGPYKLLQQIGEGGMGVVFMAEQSEPIQRTVALKIIKPGMDTRQVIVRFEAERQALALMDHPNIARVLDAGTTDTGRPYFVMDLVKGVPITEYCDRQQLSIRQRLELMADVCHAVQHAHQKGIIHRDLKPSNVLVAEYDGKPVPKIIDFGVAKATAQKLTEKTMFTEYGQLIGTFEYMSPEQARFNQLDVDTRSDIYSLGVLLYELLVGSTPLEKERLRSAAFDEILRMIGEEEPPKPSTRLSRSGLPSRISATQVPARQAGPTDLVTIAANRQSEPAKLTKLVRGELDWIVMKCLEKDRNRRYETANGLADDLRRNLADKPVEARPATPIYRLKKFALRNKAALAVVLSIVCLLLFLVGGIGWTIRDRSLRQAAQAVELAARAVELAPTQGAIWNTLGVARYRAGDWVGAIEALKKSMELRQGGDGTDWYFLSMALWQRGDRPQARLWYNVAVRWSAENPASSKELFRLRTEAAELVNAPSTLGDERSPTFGAKAEIRTSGLNKFDASLQEMLVRNLASIGTLADELDVLLAQSEEHTKLTIAELGAGHEGSLAATYDLMMLYNAARRFADVLRLLTNLPADFVKSKAEALVPMLQTATVWSGGEKRWRQCAAFYDMLLFGSLKESLGPDEMYVAMYHLEYAPVLIELDDEAGYEKVRESALTRIGNPNGIVAERLLLACTLLPASKLQMAKMERWARLNAENVPSNGLWCWNCAALALYELRNHNDAKALEWGQKCLDANPPPTCRARARVLLAIAHARFDRRQEAQAELSQCRELIEGKFTGVLGVGTYETGLWKDWLIDRVLLREADQLLAESVPTPQP